MSAARILLDVADPIELEDVVLEKGVAAAAEAPADDFEAVLACAVGLADLLEAETETA